MPVTRKNLLWGLLRWGIVAAVLVFVFLQLRDRWNEAQRLRFSLHFGWLTLSGLLYLAAWLPAAFWWRRVMQAGGERPPLGAVLRAYHLGHLGKYVPGKAMVIVIRSGIVRAAGGRPQVAALAVIYETLATMTTGSLLAGLLLLLKRHEGDGRWLTLSGVFAAVCALPMLPPLFHRMLRLTARGEGVALDRIPGRSWVGWLGMLSLGWWLAGLSLGAIVMAMAGASGASAGTWLSQWPRMTLSAALAVIAGFVAVWFPAGLGVREGVLVELLQPTLGPPQAVAVAVVWRLTTIVSEAILGAVLYVTPLLSRRPSRISE